MQKLKEIKIGLFATFALCSFLFATSNLFAASVKINKIDFSLDGSIKISISKKTDFNLFTLKNPNRLVIDVALADFAKKGYKPKLPHYASDFRSTISNGTLRMVVDLKQKISIDRVQFAKLSGKNSGSINAKLGGILAPKKQVSQNFGDFISNKVQEFDVQTKKVKNPDGSSKYIVTKTKKKRKKPVIVIDAGHGGKDPGAIGKYARTKEKNLTLSYAKELGKQLVKTKRYKVYLTRSRDKFIPLRGRVQIARRKKADLFISLHANSVQNTSTNGFSIYTLSERSSDKQAARLARKENRADIINGVNFSGASQDIVKTLIDLSQRESKNSSSRFASFAVKSIRKSKINILQNTHRFAGFAVLTAPDMISVLIELGFLTNRREERLLNSLSYKRKVSSSLVKAIDEYFKKNKI